MNNNEFDKKLTEDTQSKEKTYLPHWYDKKWIDGGYGHLL